ncbi:MAG: primosomal protein, partial [Terrimicrobiaceae bacterium]
MPLKLLVETPAPDDQYEYVVEEKNGNQPSTMYIKGPYMQCEEVNKNKRMYDSQEMDREVHRYIDEMVRTNRSMGELNHPTAAEVNLERACHLVTELNRQGNVYYGKSKVLTTPMGQIVRSLINDGVRVGMSSRALGRLEEMSNGVNKVKDFRLVAVDCVADPSFPKA